MSRCGRNQTCAGLSVYSSQLLFEGGKSHARTGIFWVRFSLQRWLSTPTGYDVNANITTKNMGRISAFNCSAGDARSGSA